MNDDDVRRCEGCGKMRPHTIRRLNRKGQPILCDSCHAGRKR